MTTEIVKIDAPELKGIEESKAKQIKATFEPMAKMLIGLEKAYDNVISEAKKEITEEVTKKAKRLRLDISKVRIQTEKVRKEQKEEYLRAGKAVDGVSNILKWAVLDKENKLKEIESYFEIQEQKRLEALQDDRAEKLSAYIEDAHERDLTKLAEDEFDALLAMKKQEKEDRIAAEKKAEEERIAKEKAEAEKRERIRKENERLKKEAKKRAKAEAERREKERKERKVYEDKLQAAREEKKRIEREERAKREKLEAELKAKEEAERKEKEQEEAKKQAELNKDDVAKVRDLISDLEALKTKYAFKSVKNKKMYAHIGILIDKVINHIQT